ncbi:polysaccharide biosynthesis protein [Candidatus Woesearchaeota archaeon]|jgi:UDP-N-acetylglucosamine 4,6-dehydratase|nr:polysaccharide biosynthesis protein [Candidatus Woesearchaeota archaeon]
MKILITGGTGTVGKALIKLNDNEYINVSRNEEKIAELKREHPEVKSYVGNIEDKGLLLRVFKDVKPDVVVHAAAMKHIDLMETNPIAGCNINVMGSLNVVEASIINDVPITVGISTDKACLAESVYGASKYLMERVFMNSNNDNANRFALTRFANVAHSNGSVLPFWLKLKSEGKPLKLTDPDMNRLIFTQEDAAHLINRTIKWTRDHGGGFVNSYKMKCINMLDLAMFIANEEVPIDIVGKRPGEKTNEDLISEREINRTYIHGDDIHIRMEENEGADRLTEPYNSKSAEMMTEEEIKELVWG